VTATLNSACTSFSQPVSKEQQFLSIMSSESLQRRLQSIYPAALNIINMKNISYNTVVNNY